MNTYHIQDAKSHDGENIEVTYKNGNLFNITPLGRSYTKIADDAPEYGEATPVLIESGGGGVNLASRINRLFVNEHKTPNP
jgi:hypothetical protein